ncbi:restriction endonuclease subunit S, partial [Escherichia coli]
PVSGGPNDTSVGEISVKTGNNARNGGKNSLNRLIRCVCGKKIGPDPRNFNQRVNLGRNDLLIRTFLSQELASKLRVSEYGDVIIVAAGETIEDIGKGTAWLGKSNVVFHDACFSYRCLLNPKYIAYFTRTKIFHDQIKKHISSGKISAINANGLSKVKIPMLSAKEQARIVEILDKFDTLTNSITEGLPREIELRQKQYEYYRDLLFSFPKPETVSN